MGDPLIQHQMPEELRALLFENYRLDCSAAASIFDGDEARVWKVTGSGVEVVVHVGPSWRHPDELDWIHRVVGFAAKGAPEVVAPISTGTGTTFVDCRGSQVAVYPFIDGRTLSREDDLQLRHAGELLARLHTALLEFEDRSRPAPSAEAPQPRETTDEPTELADQDLDEWSREARAKDWTTGIVHGDYYRRNLLCRGHEVVGVIDWHEADVQPLISEVAFAAWEMAHDDELRFLPKRSKLFVEAYAEKGPVRPWEFEALGQWMRSGLRRNIRYGLDAARFGGHSDPAYVAKQLAAFQRLKGEQVA